MGELHGTQSSTANTAYGGFVTRGGTATSLASKMGVNYVLLILHLFTRIRPSYLNLS
jgi:hypothetical protein